MGFDLLKFLTGLLGGLDVGAISTLANDWLLEKAAEYPDAEARINALAAYLSETLAETAPTLDPAKLASTIKGIAADIVHGVAGVDPDAWKGSV